jgi:hypothetical protein
MNLIMRQSHDIELTFDPIADKIEEAAVRRLVAEFIQKATLLVQREESHGTSVKYPLYDNGVLIGYLTRMKLMPKTQKNVLG